MKFPTMDEFAKNVAEKALDEYEYKGKTLRQWIEIISASEHSTNLAEVGTDCISRQAAIDALYSVDEYNSRSVKAIKQLPPIQPKRGRWIPVTNGRGGHECGQCHEYAPSYQSGEEHLSDFCPNCGAKMEVNNEGN